MDDSTISPTSTGRNTPSITLDFSQIDVDPTPPLYTGPDLGRHHQELLDKIQISRYSMGKHFSMTEAMGFLGLEARGAVRTNVAFNDLSIIQPDFLIQAVDVQLVDNRLSGIGVMYSNGLRILHGAIDRRNSSQRLTLALHRKEKIIAASMECDERDLSGIILYTNRGQSLVVRSNGPTSKIVDFDPGRGHDHLKGFWGFRSLPSLAGHGDVPKLGFVWGNHFEYDGPDIVVQGVSPDAASPQDHIVARRSLPLTVRPSVMPMVTVTLAESGVDISDLPTSTIAALCTAAGDLQIAYVKRSGMWRMLSQHPSSKWVLHRGGIDASGAIAFSGKDSAFWIRADGRVHSNTSILSFGASSAEPEAGICTVQRRDGKNSIFWIRPLGSVVMATLDSRNNIDRVTEIAGSNSAMSKTNIVAISRESAHKEVFWVGSGGAIWQSWWLEGRKSFSSGKLTSGGAALDTGHITAISRKPTRMEVFFISPAGAVNTYSYTAGSWKEHNIAPAHSALPSSDIKAVTRAPDCADLVWVAPDGSLQGAFSSAGAEWTRYLVAEPGVAALRTPLGFAACGNVLHLWFVSLAGDLMHAQWRARHL
ncbi:hypothetical protein EJ06DRAFT_527640 [Trichodelitschia bisporula]|uniref:Fucose-specific lectin n=1 Tax=Trichodelitschia bisporula TaxID=703511 RepID=A0A6G1I3A7_9PEZI|nr:hypothetical protein EJ06DRAFT_527640 [Trichodelitschia bisporula]